MLSSSIHRTAVLELMIPPHAGWVVWWQRTLLELGNLMFDPRFGISFLFLQLLSYQRPGFDSLLGHHFSSYNAIPQAVD
jgi:hypothetical protein